MYVRKKDNSLFTVLDVIEHDPEDLEYWQGLSEDLNKLWEKMLTDQIRQKEKKEMSNNTININDTAIHKAIAEKVCGWERIDRLYFVSVEGSSTLVDKVYRADSPDLPFLDANAYAEALDAARLKGWGMQITQYTEGVPYSWNCWHMSGIPRSSTHYAEDLTSAIISALYWVAQQIGE